MFVFCLTVSMLAVSRSVYAVLPMYDFNGLKVMENPLSKTGKYYRTLHNLIGSVVETSELFRLLKTAHFL
ncbi:hypothetical protein T4A_9339 [Trichinella pseudospiralis]|uniref:Uncharacterized protein n=1 Tax=Trichinella pseudospiralis TaxID=6337 RepID=A0A0V1DXY4_TRIPS|nr:hypothetical protein T4A_9339 [Trichinella pseudospiralis]